MANTYIKPETKTFKVEMQHIMAGSGGVNTGDSPTNTYTPGDVTYGKGFDFFMEEEEVPGKSDDDDWEDWEEEDDP